jgi:serine protease
MSAQIHGRLLGVTLLLLSVFLLPSTLLAQPASGEGRYMIEFRAVASGASAVRAAGGTVVHQFPELNTVAAWLPASALEALRNNPNVVAIEVDPVRQPFAQTTPYGIPMVQADSGSGVSETAVGNRKVCIIDSGYYAGHEDLQSGNVGATANSGTGDPYTDLCGHGTHVAGTIAALGNTVGVVGVVENGGLNLHIVKVFGDSCSWAYSSDLIAAANACEAAGSNVISMSLGGSFKSTTEENKFNQLYSNDILSVAAAGNAGNTRHSYPASYSSVISVAAIDSNKVVASFSQRNNQVELAAPGVGVLSTVPWVGASLTVDGVKYLASGIQYSATTAGVTGALVDGGLCDSTGPWAGNVVLCERGVISFFDKVMNVQNSKGAAAVIYNNVSGGFAGTLGDGNSSTIPAISISQEDGQFLVANKPNVSGTVVNSTATGSGYEAWDGTSMATPHVSGVAALVWSHDTSWSNATIRDALQKTAQDLGAAGRDDSYGYGLVQAKAALDYLGGGGTEPPPPPPPSGFTLSATGYKVKGVQRADLTWSGATGTNIDVYRNGAVIATTANNGAYTDVIGARGGGSYTYKVCEASTTTCSNDAVVNF